MSLSSTGRAAYISFASALTEEKRSGDAISQQPLSNRPLWSLPFGFHSNPSIKTQLYLRLVAFLIIEMGYIILAAVCLTEYIPLKISHNLSDSEVKGGFTVVFVVWQGLAVLMGSYIVTDVFSREWSVQLARITSRTVDEPLAVAPHKVVQTSFSD